MYGRKTNTQLQNEAFYRVLRNMLDSKVISQGEFNSFSLNIMRRREISLDNLIRSTGSNFLACMLLKHLTIAYEPENPNEKTYKDETYQNSFLSVLFKIWHPNEIQGIKNSIDTYRQPAPLIPYPIGEIFTKLGMPLPKHVPNPSIFNTADTKNVKILQTIFEFFKRLETSIEIAAAEKICLTLAQNREFTVDLFWRSLQAMKIDSYIQTVEQRQGWTPDMFGMAAKNKQLIEAAHLLRINLLNRDIALYSNITATIATTRNIDPQLCALYEEFHNLGLLQFPLPPSAPAPTAPTPTQMATAAPTTAANYNDYMPTGLSSGRC